MKLIVCLTYTIEHGLEFIYIILLGQIECSIIQTLENNNGKIYEFLDNVHCVHREANRCFMIFCEKLWTKVQTMIYCGHPAPCQHCESTALCPTYISQFDNFLTWYLISMPVNYEMHLYDIFVIVIFCNHVWCGVIWKGQRSAKG